MIVVVAVVALAGCADRPAGSLNSGTENLGTSATPGEGEGPVVPENLTSPELGLGAVAAEAYRLEDWFVMGGPSTPEGALRGFQWMVPEGAVVPDDFDDSLGTVALEVAPLVPPGDHDALRKWTLLAFARGEDGLQLVSTLSRGVWWGTSGVSALAIPFEEDPEFWARPLHWRLGLDMLDAGDDVFFVLAAKSTRPTELAFALRILDHDPAFNETPAADVEAFRSNTTTEFPVALPRLGSGSGFVAPAYVENHVLVALHYEGQTDDIEVRRGLGGAASPMLALYNLVLAFDFPVEAGWGYGVASFSMMAGAGQWSADVEMHEVPLQASGPALSPLLTIFPQTRQVLGVPYYFVTAGGTGGAKATFTATGIDAGYVSFVSMEHIQLGATLEQLVGEPAQSRAGVMTGVLGQQEPYANLRHDRSGAWLALPTGTLLHVAPAGLGAL